MPSFFVETVPRKAMSIWISFAIGSGGAFGILAIVAFSCLLYYLIMRKKKRKEKKNKVEPFVNEEEDEDK